MKGQTFTKNNSDVLELNDNNQLTSEDQDTKEFLEKYLDEMFTSDEEKEEIKEEQSPEVRFTRFLYKIKFIEQDIEKNKKIAEDTIKEITDWFDKRRNQLEKQIKFLSDQMQNYLIIQDLKSLSLPSGKIGFRNQVDKIEIINYDLFYNKALPELLRQVPESYEPDIPKIKMHIKNTGDIPEGLQLTPQDPKFYYKLNQNNEGKNI